MKNKTYITGIFILLMFVFGRSVFAISAVRIYSTVSITVCGNNIKETGEDCDGTDLSGESCASRDFDAGTLSCSASCDFITSACTVNSSGGNNGNNNNGNNGGGGGGGGGGTANNPNKATSVVFSGRAYPLSKVNILKDGQLALTTIAGPDSNFNATISDLSTGDYTFAVHGEDKNKNRSNSFTFPVYITSGATTNISGIFIAPTISVDKAEVRRGDNIVIFGQSVPSSEITISVNSDEEIFIKKTSDTNGVYLVNFDTSALEDGHHTAKSKVAFNGEISYFSKSVGFTVGEKNVPIPILNKSETKSDLNGDNRVNIVDFSISAFWYRRPDPPPSSDQNSDGKVDLVDFSIMAFNWTG